MLSNETNTSDSLFELYLLIDRLNMTGAREFYINIDTRVTNNFKKLFNITQKGEKINIITKSFIAMNTLIKGFETVDDNFLKVHMMCDYLLGTKISDQRDLLINYIINE